MIKETSEIIRVLKLEAEAIQTCIKRFETEPHQENAKKAVRILTESLAQNGKIIVTGVGKSGKIAQKIAATLASTGSLAIPLHPTEALHGDLGMVSQNDVVIAISYSGNTEELIRILPALKERGVKLISLSGNAKSQLSVSADVFLDLSVEQEACPHHLAPTTSTTLALAFGDALAIQLMSDRQISVADFAKNHPSGSLGKKLTLKVQDLMHSGEALPILGISATMDEVIIASTQKKMGTVLILDQKKLLGVITDGDLRRALKHREKFFKLTALDVMTKNPITVEETAMAWVALKLMEERESQISVLPVLNSKQECVGLVRLHDLVKQL